MSTTARAIITRALRLNKVIAANEPGDAADLSTGLEALNDMLDSWSLDQNFVLADVIESFPATGATSYTMGPAGNFATTAPIYVPIIEYRLNGVDYTMVEWTEEEYASIAIKNQTGQPSGYWFQKGAPNATLYFANAPASGTFRIHSVKAITSFSDLDTAYEMAPGYKNALIYSLAVDSASEFEAEVSKTVLLRAMNLKRSLKRSNAVIPVMNPGVPITPYRYGYSL